MNEPNPRRWTIRWHDPAEPWSDLIGDIPVAIDAPVEVIPVPDEQAIERAAKALARRYGEEVGFADWLGIARTVASALEPPE